MKRWAVVVPSNRPERLEEFRRSWAIPLGLAELIVVRDEPPWDGIPEFIPRRTDMIRSWGFYLAWKLGVDYTLSLDDDVLPAGDLLREYECEFERLRPHTEYLSVGAFSGTDHEMRGFPYADRQHRVGLQFGGWHGVADYDAVTQIAHAPGKSAFSKVVVPVPRGSAVTGCAMNFAFRSELTPYLWQLPLLEGRYNRFGDIWAGLFAKRTLDHLGLVTLVNGRASVFHERASDPHANLVREAPGIGPNEGLWAALPEAHYGEVTDAAADYFNAFDHSYAEHFVSCRDAWLSLFRKSGNEPSESTVGSTETRESFSTA